MEAERQAANKLLISLKQQSDLPNVIAALASTNSPIGSCSNNSLNTSQDDSEKVNESPLNKLILMEAKLADE